MKRVSRYTILGMFFLFLSGCIFSKTPDPNTDIILLKGNQVTLTINSVGDNQWLLQVNDEDPIELDGETGTSYVFNSSSYDLGTYSITVRNTYLGYIENCQWTVIVKETNASCTDNDSDGYSVEGGECGPVDCNDDNAAVHPNAIEGSSGDPVCGDSLDNDCDGLVDDADTGCQECLTATDCDDGNPCTTDSCVEGACVNTNNTLSCDDGNGCTVNDVCSGGSCVAGPQMDCNDNNECTDDSCMEGACVNANNTASCDDGDGCTMNDTCGGGACSGDPLDADGDNFVSDSCGGDDCDDGNASVNPGAKEGAPGDEGTCSDFIDNDCDGAADGSDSDCAETTPPQNVNASDVNLDPSGDPMDNSNFNDRVTVGWDLVSWATDYEIYTSTEPEGTYTYKGTVPAPILSFDDIQTDSLVIQPKPAMGDYFADTSDPQPEELEAYDTVMVQWEKETRTAINDFKNFTYYKVRAFNAVTESELSDYDEGKMDYTNAEGWKLADALTQLMIYEVMKEVGKIDPISNNYDFTYCDECTPGCVAEPGNDGTIQIYIGGNIISKTIRFTLTNFRTSVDYDASSETIGCDGRRSVTLNGTLGGTLFLGSGDLEGTFYLTGGGIGEADVTVPVSLGTIGTGKVTLRYNGEECFECYTIGLDL